MFWKRPAKVQVRPRSRHQQHNHHQELPPPPPPTCSIIAQPHWTSVVLLLSGNGNYTRALIRIS